MNNAFYIAGDRGKGKQGLVRNYIYYMGCMKEWDKKLFFATILVALPLVASMLLQTLLPSVLIQGLEEKPPIGRLLAQMGALSGLLWLLGTLAGVMQEYGYTGQSYFSLYFMKKYVSKIMQVDYEKLDDKEFRNLSGNVWNAGLYGRGIRVLHRRGEPLFPLFRDAAAHGHGFQFREHHHGLCAGFPGNGGKLGGGIQSGQGAHGGNVQEPGGSDVKGCVLFLSGRQDCPVPCKSHCQARGKAGADRDSTARARRLW